MKTNAYIPPKSTQQTKERFNRRGTKVVSTKSILEVVEKHFGLTRDDLIKVCRKREILYPRQVATYLVVFYSGLSLEGCGVLFGQHYSTCLNSIESIENWMDSDEKAREQICNLINEISL